MTTFIRGQRSKLSALGVSHQLRIGVGVTAPAVVIDVSCFGLDANGRLSDDRYFIFFNQKSSPCGSISMLGQSDHGRADFSIDLSKLPASIRKLAITITIDGPGTMRQITRGHLRVQSEGREAAVYEFTGADFGAEKSVILAEVYFKDVWRFAAVGQGFTGDLATLVTHYGGEVAEGPAPAPPVQPLPPPTPLPDREPPHSPPGRVEPSPPPAPDDRRADAPPPVLNVSGRDLRDLITAAPPGATLELLPGEYQGPIVVGKPLTIRGNKSTVWCRRGPVITVAHEDVSLSDVDIQVTILDGDDHDGDAEVALKLVGAHDMKLENVSVRGNVLGLDGESGEWRLPLTLRLGGFAPRRENSFLVSVEVPTACWLKTQIEGLTISPASLGPGTHDLNLTISDVPPNTLILGRIQIRTARVVRLIEVTGHTLEPGAPACDHVRLEN